MAENILRKFSDLSFQDRENIIQNVLIRLLKGGLSKFQGSTKYEFFKYFKRIVINEAISYLKSGGRDKKDVSLNGEVNGENSEGSPLKLKDLIPNQDPRPDLVAEEREYLDRTKKIMEKFSLLDQQIFLMKINGYKDEEIKKILNIPLGTVASKYSRIRSKIMEELGEG
jgi:RNA polymerase sigma factor (sigma-70 family)